jgi:putative glutamine amidotransferase
VGPRIGITTYARTSAARPSFSVPCTYVEAVAVAGGVPVLLPPLADAEAVLDGVDGLIVPGGGDVEPVHYGGGDHAENYDVCRERDGFELRLVRAALARERFPLLAICRGMQVLNVALGGSLIAHLPDVFGESVPHRGAGLTAVEHSVAIDADSRVRSAHGVGTMAVQSIHHQAVGRPGNGLAVAARSSDGVIEAIEVTSHGFALGVQWHPELSAPGSDARRVFHELVGACRPRPVSARHTRAAS